MGLVRMGEGTVTETNAYAREVMSLALQRRAASVVLSHNHPSGDPTPSSADAELTRGTAFAGAVMGVRVQDHVVIGDDSYFSFAEHGLIDTYDREWSDINSKGESA